MRPGILDGHGTTVKVRQNKTRVRRSTCLVLLDKLASATHGYSDTTEETLTLRKGRLFPLLVFNIHIE